jgi:hypothetical protein
MSTKTKKKRQLRAQSRLALARQKQLERERRRDIGAHRAEKRWDKTLRQLVALGATLEQREASTGSIGSPEYRVVYERYTYLLRNRSQVQRWVKRTQERLEEQQMSWAERHVLWMIENNCDDQGRPWPE